MLTHPEDVEAHLVGEDHLLDEIAEALPRARPPGRRIGRQLAERVEADLHRGEYAR